MSQDDRKIPAILADSPRLPPKGEAVHGGVEKDQKEKIERRPAVASFGEDDSYLEMTPEETRRLKRIVDWKIVPYCSLLYLLSESCLVNTVVFALCPGASVFRLPRSRMPSRIDPVM